MRPNASLSRNEYAPAIMDHPGRCEAGMKFTQGRLGLSFLFIAMVLLPAHNVLAWFATKTRADGSGVFATGRYRNLFAEFGHPQKESVAKIDAAFQQLFHGDPKMQSVVFTAWQEHQWTAGLSHRLEQPRRTHRRYVLWHDDRRPARQESRVRCSVELGEDLHVHQRSEAPVVWLFLMVMQDGRYSE
jgi:hypothetical protein